MRRSGTVPYHSPFTAQRSHFCSVIRGEETPVITAEDGLLTLATTLAILESSRSGQPVDPLALFREFG